MFLHIGLHVRDDDVGTLHHTPTDHDDFRVVSVHQGHGIDRPDVQAAIADREGDAISICRFFEEFSKPDIWILR